MKKTSHLILLAQKLSVKYAETQTLQEIIGNAASYGESSANGIMDFLSQLERDNAELSIGVSISKGGLTGGTKIIVTAPNVYPPEVASNYAKLPEQIKKYLEKNIQYFPQVGVGTFTLEYPATSDSNSKQIAGR